jgi:DNA-binding transcriptional regulator YhcF (GntR family)
MESRVELFALIRRDARVEGLSVRALADRHKVHRRTVRQALESASPPERKPRQGAAWRLEPFKTAVDAMLTEDTTAPRKQRHTARRILARLIEEHGAEELSYSTVHDYVRVRRALLPATGQEWDGTITAQPDGTFTIARAGEQAPFPAPKAHAAELSDLLELRDGARSLLEMEASDSEDTPAMSAQRTALADQYTAYAAKYGPLNRFTESVRTDKETGEDIVTRRAAPAVRILRQTDPFGTLPPALERFNEETQTATPAGLLQHRQVVARKPLMGADTIDEALAITLDTYGAPELEPIADLLGITKEEARDQRGTLVFDDPETGQLVTAPEYLSGNVRTKLEAARAAAAGDERWSVNVTALEEVQPPRVGTEDVEARLGAVWISPEEHQRFVQDILADPNASVSSVGGGIWRVKANCGSVRSTNEWGTSRRPAPDLLQSSLEQKAFRSKTRTPTASPWPTLKRPRRARKPSLPRLKASRASRSNTRRSSPRPG